MNGWIYETTPDNRARFLLGKDGDNPLIGIGINCSTASPEKLDNTVRRIPSFAARLGYDGWLMLNVYPQRATDPKEMHKLPDRKLHEMNMRQWEKIAGWWDRPTVWCAWGRLIRSRPWLRDCLADLIGELDSANPKYVHLGERTKDGDPRHPLYLKGDSKPEPFDPHTYLKECF